jgi:Abnormal spindle-like microcephaly-assoc'd, ASPM-SPD-2-Hydin
MPRTLGLETSECFYALLRPIAAVIKTKRLGAMLFFQKGTPWSLSLLMATLIILPSLTVTSARAATGKLTCNLSTLSFGYVGLNRTKSIPITLTNRGVATLTISQITKTNSRFEVHGLTLPHTLGTGKSARLYITFTPTQVGHIDASVTFASNASDPKLPIYVHGTGINAGILAAYPPALWFGRVSVSQTKTMTAILSNTGSKSLTISKISSSNTHFKWSGISLPLTLSPWQTAKLNVTLKPTTTGTLYGQVAVASNAVNSLLTIHTQGTGMSAIGYLLANPGSISFGPVRVGSVKRVYEALSNTGSSSLTISSATITVPEFQLSDLALPLTLPVGHSVTFQLSFAPKWMGPASGSLVVNSSARNATLRLPLWGTGGSAGQLSMGAANLNFGNVSVGQSKQLTASLKASGSSVTVSSATSTSSEFRISGLVLPLKLAAGQSATFGIRFAPNASGTASGKISFLSNASNSPTVENLTGNGVVVSQHSVSLFWQRSSSTVAGYNVYRSTTLGGPYTRISSALNTATSFVDRTVQAGKTYYYVTTAVTKTGIESRYSNQVKAVVPSQ